MTSQILTDARLWRHSLLNVMLFSYVLLIHWNQRVEPFNFSGSGSVWVQQRFQISVQFRLRFR